ncbi:PIN domain-containing protein [Psychromonas sp. KJ10-10]|uniref:PIN domain-containing protein n=1 Tax=Psychromonas sp. KJ10-10 TaxID=3391823 RepID=UPI0039B62770
MKWAFIDYENVGCLSNIELSVYEKVIVFIGAKQPKLDFGSKKYEMPINLVIIQIKATQSNNLDFHLSYYLGKYDFEAKSGVAFDVITNDNGFAPLIAHIKCNGRSCKQIKLSNSSGKSAKLVQSLTCKPADKRPKKVESLRNHIASHMRIKGNEVAIQNHLNQLVNEHVLTISESGVKYKC